MTGLNNFEGEPPAEGLEEAIKATSDRVNRVNGVWREILQTKPITTYEALNHLQGVEDGQYESDEERKKWLLEIAAWVVVELDELELEQGID